MSKEIICQINLGDFKQKLYLKEGSTIKTFSLTVDDISDFIINQPEAKDIYLSGASKAFLQNIELVTNFKEQKKYNKNTKIFHYN